MSGSRTEVAKRISNEEPCAVFTHCYGHSVNLACSDTVMEQQLEISCIYCNLKVLILYLR